MTITAAPDGVGAPALTDLGAWLEQLPEIELRLVAAGLHDPRLVDAARAITTPADFRDVFLAAAWDELARIPPDAVGEVIESRAVRIAEGLISRHGFGFDALKRVVLVYAEGGDLSDVFDPGATVRLARMLRRAQLNTSIQDAARRLVDDPTPTALARVAALGAALGGLEESRRTLPLEELGFTGPRLRALLEREPPVSPLPGLLDPEPHVHLLIARPKTGKTTFALALARAWVMGVPPWPGAPALPGSRALVISKEQNATQLAASLRRLSVYSDAGNGDGWNDTITIIARDRELAAEARSLLLLDAPGLEQLRHALLEAKQAGSPYGLLVLDSLSRLKPPDVEEIDNDGMTCWLDALEDIASSLGVYTLLIHHQGHAEGGHRSDARSAGRGASAIAAVAQATWLLERTPDHPHRRVLKVDGNSLLPHEITFEVAPEDADPGLILRFRPCSPVADAKIDELLGQDETISTEELAWRVSGTDRVSGQRAPRRCSDEAAAIRERWVRQGLIDVVPGPRGAKHIRRRAPEQEQSGDDIPF